MRLSVIVFFIITLATSLFGENELLPALVSGGQPIVPLQIITQLGGERFYSPETPPPPGVDGYKYNEGGIFFGNKTCCLFYLLNKNIAEINGKNHYYKYKTSLNPSFRLLNEVGIIYVSLDLIKLIFEIKVPFNAHSRSLTFVNPATKKEFILPITADMSYTGKPEVDELQVASALGDFDSVRHIISSHPELMNISANWDGQTALCRAVDGNHEQIVRYMISHGADVNGNHKSNTPLVLAAKNGNIPIARMLIHHGAWLGIGEGNAMQNAVISGQLPMLKFLYNVEHKKSYIKTKLADMIRLAVRYEFTDITEYLFSCGTSINLENYLFDPPKTSINFEESNHQSQYYCYQSPYYWTQSPYYDVIKYGHSKIFKVLLRHTPKTFLYRNGPDMLMTIEKEGMVIPVPDDTKEIMITVMLNAGVSPNILDDNVLDDNGTTILIQAIYNGDVPVVRALLNHKALPDLPIANGLTPLYIAVYQKNYKIAELLLRYGASVDKTITVPQQFKATTAIELAKELNDYRMVSLLERYRKK